MRLTRLLAVTLCGVILAGVGLGIAQQITVRGEVDQAVSKASDAAATLDQRTSVLKAVPSGSLGVVVINDVKSTSKAVDRFIQQIGLGDMTKQMMPKGSLQFVIDQLQLGEGFTGEGGVALAMLDPETVDMDFVELLNRFMNQMMPMGPQMQQPQQEEEIKLPFLLIMPGKDVSTVFAKYQPEKDGQFTKITLPTGEMTGVTLGDHIVLSPGKEALNVMMKAKGSIISDMPKNHAATIAQSDIGIFVNMKETGPIFNGVIKSFEQKIKQQQESLRQMYQENDMAMPPMAMGPMGMMNSALPHYRKMVDQLETITIGGRFVETGIVLEELVNYKEGSDLGKKLVKLEPTGQINFNKLPDLPYVLAASGQMLPGLDNAASTYTDMFDGLFRETPAGALSPETHKKIDSLVKGAYEHIDTIQFVGGGAPGGKGLFSLGMVITCDDSAKVKKLLQTKTEILNTIFSTKMGNIEDDFKDLKISYVKGSQTVKDTEVDVVDITHPEMASMSERVRDEMQKVLGEDRFRIYIAAPDKKTVLVSFAGTVSMIEELMKTDDGSGRIGKSKFMKEPMKYMPEQPALLVAFNGSNLFDLIIAGTRKMDPDAELPAGRIACRTPIMVGSEIDGLEVHTTCYVPAKLVKDSVVLYLSIQGGGGGPIPPANEADF